MRYAQDHKDQTHERLLRTAAQAIRQGGPERLSIGRVMRDAGLTHGGFYHHFQSRSDLIVAAVDYLLREHGEPAALLAGPDPEAALACYLDFYLSLPHRDAEGASCPFLFLLSGGVRLPVEARRRVTGEWARMNGALAALLAKSGRPDPGRLAQAVLAEIVGRLSLARIEPDEAVAAAQLEAARHELKARLGLVAACEA